MKQPWYVRAAFAGIVGLSIAAGLARAGDNNVPPASTAPPGVVPAAGFKLRAGGDRDGSSDCGCDKDGDGRPSRFGKGKAQEGERRLRIFCWSTHNSLGCGSFNAECKFLWGSCRTFFGEPCWKGPPPSPIPPPPPGWNGGPPPFAPEPGYFDHGTP